MNLQPERKSSTLMGERCTEQKVNQPIGNAAVSIGAAFVSDGDTEASKHRRTLAGRSGMLHAGMLWKTRGADVTAVSDL